MATSWTKTEGVRSDSRRIRATLIERVCECIDLACGRTGTLQATIDVVVPGRSWRITPAGPRPAGTATMVAVSFLGPETDAVTLQANETIVETGVMSVNVVIPSNWCGSGTLVSQTPANEADRIVGSVTGSFTAGMSASVTIEADPMKGDPAGMVSTVQVVGAATVATAYRDSYNYIVPVMIPYRGTTDPA